MYTWACYLKFSVFPAQENKPTVTGMSAVEVFVIKTLRQINAPKSAFLGNCCCCAVLKNRLACTLKGISKNAPFRLHFMLKSTATEI